MKKKLAFLLLTAGIMLAAATPAAAAALPTKHLGSGVDTAFAILSGKASADSLLEKAPLGTVLPDAAGTVSFENLPERVRTGYPYAKAVEENISILEEMDYQILYNDTLKMLNGLTAKVGELNAVSIGSLEFLNQQLGLGQSDADIAYSVTMAKTQVMQLDAQREALQETVHDMQDGDFQEAQNDQLRQARMASDQLVMMAEKAYIAILALEQSEATLTRKLDALDRTLEAMELRYELGQISALTLQQLKTNRTTLASSLTTLEMNIAHYKAQLQVMVGASPTGEIMLLPVSAVSQSELDAMDLATDMALAKEINIALEEAQETYDEAKDQWEDDARSYAYGNYPPKRYQYDMALHTWNAAQYTYDAAHQDFELAFKVLYNTVKDNAQVLEAAKETYAYQQRAYAVAELKYQQGSISASALADARDTLAEAADTVNIAQANLTAAYTNYRWAVDSGILN